MEIFTYIVVCRQDDGTTRCFPAADPTLVTCGPEDRALLEMQMFLEEWLPRQPPETMARFACPTDTKIEETDIQIDCPTLIKSLGMKTPVTFFCLILPHGKDRWVIVPVMEHVFHLAPDDDFHAIAASEMRRMITAHNLSVREILNLFPDTSCDLKPMHLHPDMSAHRKPENGRSFFKKRIQIRQDKDAVKILASVGTPLHKDTSVIHGPLCVGRDADIAAIDRMLTGANRMSVMIISPEMAGKTALIHGWLQIQSRKAESKSKRRKRVYGVSGAQLLAGMSGMGQWEERVLRVMKAAAHLDAVLYFDHLSELFSDHAESQTDIAGVMRPFIEEGRVRIIGEVRPEQVDYLETRHMGFISALNRLVIAPVDKALAHMILENRVAHESKRHPNRPNLDMQAIPALMDLTDRYFSHQAHPGKALRFYETLRTLYEQSDDWETAGPITENQVFEAFSAQYGIPVFLLRKDRSLYFDHIMAFFTNRLIGQTQAVRRIAETLCIAKAGLQPAEKPLASFLFIGPTGVGKTETSLILARFLFGSADRLTRFDMSEYTDGAAAQRLIKGSDGAGGLLTRRIRRQPFGVLLLDEIEKAHPAVFDLLLQVFGEARLTDEKGRTTLFHNTIIIMTSNLGAVESRRGIGFKGNADTDAAFYEKQVNNAFRPEFVNRIDRIIPFHALDEAQIMEITRVMITRLESRPGFSEKGLHLDVSADALARIGRKGYSATLGARRLKRCIEENMVTPLSYLIAEAGKRSFGANVVVTAPGEDPEQDNSRLIARHEGDLVIGIAPGTGKKSRSGKDNLHEAAGFRRMARECMALDTVAEIKDRLDLLITGMIQGKNAANNKRGQGAGSQWAQMRTEYDKLRGIWGKAEAALEKLEAAEEMMLTALFEGEDPALYREDCETTRREFMVNLFYLLTANRKDADQVTLLVQELDDKHALNLWLTPLLHYIRGKNWRIVAHIERDQETVSPRWPRDRRWGPPMDADSVLDRLWIFHIRPAKFCDTLYLALWNQLQANQEILYENEYCTTRKNSVRQGCYQYEIVQF